MAGTVTVTEPTKPVLTGGMCNLTKQNRIVQVVFDWLSDASGDVSGTKTVAKFTEGIILGAVDVPDTGGTIPDNDYDVYLHDDNGIDLFIGNGVNLQQTGQNVIDGTYFTGFLPVHIESGTQLEIVVDQAGAANGGTLYVWLGPAK